MAALQWLLARCQAAQAILVGHSAGGQMLGLLPNHAQVARLVHEAEAPKADPAQILTQRLGSQIGPRKDRDAIVIEGVGNLLVASVGRRFKAERAPDGTDRKSVV